MKKLLRALLCVLLALLVAVGGYVAYVFIDYYRLEDNLPLEVAHGDALPSARTGTPYHIVSWNIGFGAYEADYGFFMDGGTQSRVWSEERLDANLSRIAAQLNAQNADVLFVQEIDLDSTRSCHVDELARLEETLSAAYGRHYARVAAQNYDSPYLFYPLTQPHGASRACLATFSAFSVSSALRRSLPIEGGFMKFLDLDRCYSVSRVPVDNGKELVLFNLHLSAYTSDGAIATEQLRLLLQDMQQEYERGNYCVAGGDFNKDLLGDSSAYFGTADREYSWAQPIPAETFDGVDITLIAPLDEADPVPSCRNADGPYHEGQYVLTVDGFLISPNAELLASGVIDDGFRSSDHNPVYLDLILLP